MADQSKRQTQLRSPQPIFQNNNASHNQQSKTNLAEIFNSPNLHPYKSKIEILPLKVETSTSIRTAFALPSIATTVTSSANSVHNTSGYDTASPDFDSIVELPTPILPSAASSPPMNSSGLQRSPGKEKKIMYGSLGFQPPPATKSPSCKNTVLDGFTSFQQHQHGQINDPSCTNNRIISEYGSMNSLDRFTDASKSHLDPKSITSSQRRNASTPISERDVTVLRHHTNNPMEREEGNVSSQILPNEARSAKEIIYKGTDLNGKKHMWRHVKQVGKGNFSTVALGELIPNGDDDETGNNQQIDGEYKDKNLGLKYVAVKIVHVSANSKNRNRVESSLTRELDLLRVMNHPSIINLVALDITGETYYIMTPYYEGGDLFELASLQKLDFPPILIRRIFAELASAVSYLHHNNIVHRDIKLENVLINYKSEQLVRSATQLPENKPIITLTDFGLSRAIDPENPLLQTRCGSEDYVPPELLIGLPYDGRQTDSWALGVLLYALMENRLPFDLPPTKSIRGTRSRVTHRIARIEWSWDRFSKDNKGVLWREEDWAGAIEIVEGLLVKRDRRLTSAEVCQREYVRDVLGSEFLKVRSLNIIDGSELRREV